ncbi:MAG: SUMF1/EgtB/PvdO family nonheme iron enzyme [Planctomycetes bacterium]|nr:SUMF1/EgtB/PvdO family nonheme iron enzyme [Planctomycetota bacterium]MBL7038021.1 SUMF1/EgtB/PvdO family nonheme iron enzyme [Pirellulaceae bacterium]
MRTGVFLMVVLIATAPATGVGPSDIVVNSVGMKLAYIPPGDFTMGSPKTEPGRIANETRRHVTFERGFRIGITEVTQKEWRLIMGTSPAFFKGDDLPVKRSSDFHQTFAGNTSPQSSRVSVAQTANSDRDAESKADRIRRMCRYHRNSAVATCYGG